MCIIVDANAASELQHRTDDGKPILKWLLRGRGGLVVGGKLLQELINGGLSSTMAELSRAGRVHRISNEEIQISINKISQNSQCKSNDIHVIALAHAANCRLIFSKDKKLHEDLKDSSVLSPVAKIYQNAGHAHLLKDCKCSQS